MGTAESLSHTKGECKHHLAWIPKCRRTVLYGQLRKIPAGRFQLASKFPASASESGSFKT